MSQVFTDEAEQRLDEALPQGWSEYVRDMGKTMKNSIGSDQPMIVNYQTLTIPLPEWNHPESDRTVTLFSDFQFGNVES